jgi:hypothetical protein
MSTLDKIDPPVVEPDNVEPQPRQGRGESPTITGDTARQGPKGSRILYVLIAGAIGAFIAMALIWAYFVATSPA